MITFHFHLQPQYKYELFHIKTSQLQIYTLMYECNEILQHL